MSNKLTAVALIGVCCVLFIMCAFTPSDLGLWTKANVRIQPLGGTQYLEAWEAKYRIRKNGLLEIKVGADQTHESAILSFMPPYKLEIISSRPLPAPEPAIQTKK